MVTYQNVSTYILVQVFESYLISEAKTDEERIAIYQHMGIMRDAIYMYELRANHVTS